MTSPPSKNHHKNENGRRSRSSTSLFHQNQLSAVDTASPVDIPHSACSVCSIHTDHSPSLSSSDTIAVYPRVPIISMQRNSSDWAAGLVNKTSQEDERRKSVTSSLILKTNVNQSHFISSVRSSSSSSHSEDDPSSSSWIVEKKPIRMRTGSVLDEIERSQALVWHNARRRRADRSISIQNTNLVNSRSIVTSPLEGEIFQKLMDINTKEEAESSANTNDFIFLNKLPVILRFLQSKPFHYSGGICRGIVILCGLRNAISWPFQSTEYGFIPWTTACTIVTFFLVYPMLYIECMLYHIVQGNIGVVIQNLNTKMAPLLLWMSSIVPVVSTLCCGIKTCRVLLYVFVYSFEYSGDTPSTVDATCAGFNESADCIQYHTGLDLLNSLTYPCTMVQDDASGQFYCRSKIFRDSLTKIQSIDGLFLQYPDPNAQSTMSFEVAPSMFVLMLVSTLVIILIAAHREFAFSIMSCQRITMIIVGTLVLNNILVCCEIATRISSSVLWNVFTLQCSFDAFFNAKMWAASITHAVFSLQLMSGINVLLVKRMELSDLRFQVLSIITVDTMISFSYGVVITFLYAYVVQHYYVLCYYDMIEFPPLTPAEIVALTNPLVASSDFFNGYYSDILFAFAESQMIYTLVPSIINEIASNRPAYQILIKLTYYGPIGVLATATLLALWQRLSEIICESRFLTDYISWATKNDVALFLFVFQIPHIILMTSSWGEILSVIEMTCSGIWAISFVYLMFMYLMFSFNLMRMKELLKDRGRGWIFPLFFTSLLIWPVTIAFGSSIFKMTIESENTEQSVLTLDLVTSIIIAFIVYLHCVALIAYIYLTEPADVTFSISHQLLYRNIYSTVIRYRFTVYSNRESQGQNVNDEENEYGFPIPDWYRNGFAIWSICMKGLFPAIFASAISVQFTVLLNHLKAMTELSDLQPRGVFAMVALSTGLSIFFFCCIVCTITLKAITGRDMTKYLCPKTNDIQKFRRLSRVDKKEPDLMSRFLAVIPQARDSHL